MKQKKTKVLLIEDDPILASNYAANLEELSYMCKFALDGNAGIEEAGKFQPDIILLDIILPGKDGLAVLKILKSAKETKDIAVILLSNLGEDGVVSQCMDLGAEKYLIKIGCTPSQIASEIDKIVKKDLSKARKNLKQRK